LGWVSIQDIRWRFISNGFFQVLALEFPMRFSPGLELSITSRLENRDTGFTSMVDDFIVGSYYSQLTAMRRTIPFQQDKV
jgi:hypothetical protein